MALGRALPGHFYAVGTGPGAPDLLTVRAVRLIESADVIVAPRSASAEESLALRTVADVLRGGRAEVIECVYPMERDPEKTRQVWGAAAREVASRCGQGQSVVQITLGDPLLYSTSGYLLELVSELLPAERIHVAPGIAAFQSAASLLGEPLALQEDRLLLMTAADPAEVEQALQRCETLVLYKAGPHLAALVEVFERNGVLDRARLVCYAEQEGKQFVTRDLREAADGSHGYLATVIVHVGRRTWDRARARPGSREGGSP